MGDGLIRASFQRADDNWELLYWTTVLILTVAGVGMVASIFGAIAIGSRDSVGPVSARAFMFGCGVLVTAPVLAVFDQLVLETLVDDSGADGPFLPVVGWGILSGIAVLGGTLLGGAAFGWNDAELLRTFLVVLGLWDGLTPAVSVVLLDSRQSLWAAITEGWRRQLAAPIRTAATGVVVGSLGGLATLVAAVAVGWTLLCLFLFWLVFPLLGLLLTPAMILVTVLAYAYSRALKIEAYREAGETTA